MEMQSFIGYVFILFLFFNIVAGTSLACSPDLSIIAVFEDFDTSFSDIVSKIDTLIRKKAIIINMNSKVDFDKVYITDLNNLFFLFLKTFSKNTPPKMIYDKKLWQNYRKSFIYLSRKIVDSAQKNKFKLFHNLVDEFENLLLKMYKVRGKKTHRILYPLLIKFRRNPSKLKSEILLDCITKLETLISVLSVKNKQEEKLLERIIELKNLTVAFNCSFFSCKAEKQRIELETYFSELIRIENSILNMRWFK